MCKDLKALNQQIASILNNDKISEESRITKVLSKTKLYATTVAKDIQIPNDLLEDISIIQNTDITKVTLQKYDLIKTLIGPCEHYCIVAKIDKEMNIAWVVSLTSDLQLPNIIPIKGSRLFNTFYCAALYPVYIKESKTYAFCGIFDAKKDFDKVYKAIKNYYKINFR